MIDKIRMTGRLLAVILTLIVQHIGLAQPDGAEHEFLTRDEALLDVFPTSTTYVSDVIALSPAEVARAEETLFRKLDETAQEVIRCYDGAGRFLGYAVISEETGKYRPITYIVGINPDFEVARVAIMVYREDRGGEIQTPRFLYQYKGKSMRDPIRTNRDIVNISGATISVRSINAGVKKVLYLVTEHYGEDPPAAMLSKPVEVDRAEQ